MNVTILGAGRMGTAMAARLAEGGYSVTLWDRDPIRAHREVSLGVAADANVTSAVADASVIITMVTDGQAVHDVAEQLLPAMSPSAVWVQASTVGAEWADRLRSLADEWQRSMLDAPVSGSTVPARSGRLSWLVAGPPHAVSLARPVMDRLGERVIVVGDRQEASRLKLIVNTWMTSATVAMADALAASDRIGVPRSALLEVLSDGPLGMPYAIQKAQLMNGHDFTPGFSVELALKDIQLAAQAEGRQSPLTRTLEERLTRAIEAGHAHDDLAAVASVD